MSNAAGNFTPSDDEREETEDDRIRRIQSYQRQAIAYESKYVRKPVKKQPRPRPQKTPKQRIWVFFRDSGHWVSASEAGAAAAVARGQIVIRSCRKPWRAPEVIKEPMPKPCGQEQGSLF